VRHAGDVPASDSPAQADTREEPGGEASQALAPQLLDDLRRLGEALSARTADVVEAMLAGSEDSGVELDPVVDESFARVGAVSTAAVARWMAGESADVAREVGQESWRVFGQLAAQRAAPLNEVTKRCLRWRDAAERVVREIATALELSPEALAHALGMLQRSLDVTIVRMAQSFELERNVAHEELSKRQEELAFLATHDALTGLPNRTLILDRIEQALARARRNPAPVGVLFIDLDNFKAVNETLGHSAGDELLRAVTARLEGVVGATDALARLGGDEFVVVAEGESLARGPEPIAERLLVALNQPFELSSAVNKRLTVTASIGIASGERQLAEELLRDGGIAMYRAKRAGRNRCVVFESGMQELVQSQMELRMSLRDALSNGEFFLVYQPTFDLRSLSPTGMEALIRWNHPTRGIVQPDDFVPLLEETGMIVEAGRWVLKEACSQGAAWRASGYRIGIAVNVSTLQLETDEFLGDMSAALSDSGLDPAALTIELTETAIMSDADATVERLTKLREMGVRIAIDDFGAGYSSLAYLQRFPVDVLKIDRSFIARLTKDPDGEKLIRTLVQLGKSLSIETLAEGIEQSSELSLLKDEQCRSGQGFLFARPLDLATSDVFLHAWLGDGVPPQASTSAGAGSLPETPVPSSAGGRGHELPLGVDAPAPRHG
jgi:diguanylate cyclase (GGDEF)-like protein